MPRSGPRLGRQRLAVEQDRAARRPLLPEHHAQERALAAARRTDDRDEGARGDIEIDALQHDLVAVFHPDVADRDRAHQRRSSTAGPGKRRPRQAREREVHEIGEQRDPGDVGQDHIHREIAPHQEDAVAEPALGGDGLGRDQEQEGRPERQPHRLDQPRHDLRQHDADRDLPGRGAQRLRLDELLGRQRVDGEARGRASGTARRR